MNQGGNHNGPRQHHNDGNQGGGSRRGRRNRRGRQRSGQSGGGESPVTSGPPPVIVPDDTTEGWFDASRDAGFIRRAANSYLADSGDAYVGSHLIRQFGIRRGDLIMATTGRDHRGRVMAAEITSINGGDPALALKRADFNTLTASYPERKLVLETGRPAKGGPELTRRAIDLIAPIGFGQRALIVAPARAGKTMLLHAITEGVSINHPGLALLILLVDERPEEVSEAISWGVAEVIASSFDQPASRHVEVTIWSSSARVARWNRAGRGDRSRLAHQDGAGVQHGGARHGRTLSGGLDSSAMAKPKAFFGSARSIAPEHGGGSLTIIATALVETGSRMDDVIFEEFKGTGNCEIKLDRPLAEKRIFPAIDIARAARGARRNSSGPISSTRLHPAPWAAADAAVIGDGVAHQAHRGDPLERRAAHRDSDSDTNVRHSPDLPLRDLTRRSCAHEPLALLWLQAVNGSNRARRGRRRFKFLRRA